MKKRMFIVTTILALNFCIGSHYSFSQPVATHWPNERIRVEPIAHDLESYLAENIPTKEQIEIGTHWKEAFIPLIISLIRPVTNKIERYLDKMLKLANEQIKIIEPLRRKAGTMLKSSLEDMLNKLHFQLDEVTRFFDEQTRIQNDEISRIIKESKLEAIEKEELTKAYSHFKNKKLFEMIGYLANSQQKLQAIGAKYGIELPSAELPPTIIVRPLTRRMPPNWQTLTPTLLNKWKKLNTVRITAKKIKGVRARH